MTARLVTYTHQNRTSFGAVVEGGIVDLAPLFPDYADLKAAIAAGALPALAKAAEGRAADVALSDVTLESPVPSPEKIICVGVNYPSRNEEYKDGSEAPANMSLFIRFPDSFTGHGQNIIRPPESPQFDYEGEVVLVIGKGGRRISQEDALDHVAAISLANEGTIRDWVRHAKFNVTQGKNWDRSGAIGPWLVVFEDESQIADIQLETRVNGELRQSDRTGRMMFPFRRIIEYISTFATLKPGDVILTGTPTGAGARFDPPIWLVPGDVVEVSATGIGTLSNTVADEELSA
ncbi:fumarylacetoacetate hydrolase family protein [Rhodovulum sp. DZ06]|uniref:fumarylacetoacetate hydrolase family protein n=1 Tax=Rhodovulum sp. DZ06 TaxID=3425126 RepID=UPI003D3427BA